MDDDYMVWTATVVLPMKYKLRMPVGADQHMRRGVQAAVRAMLDMTDEDDLDAHYFTGWGEPLEERYRAVIENRYPNDDVMRSELLEDYLVCALLDAEYEKGKAAGYDEGYEGGFDYALELHGLEPEE